MIKLKTILCAGSILISGMTMAQQTPAASGSAGASNGSYWSRAGNTNATNSNNIFGTRWNSPIYFITGGLTQGTYRMKLNGTYAGAAQYDINNYNSSSINTSGYLGLGYNMAALWSQNPSPGNAAKGPFSLLHLNGRDGSFVQESGFRPWMKTGVTFTDNNDLSYVGLRKMGTGTDKTEMVVAWADNAEDAFPGPDDMAFRFTRAGNGNTTINTSNSGLRDPNDLDGLHVARFTGTGLMGLGNTFGSNTPSPNSGPYVRPKSLLHMSYDHEFGSQNEPYGFMQITYRETNPNLNTGETANDGLRFGIDNDVYGPGSGLLRLNGFLRWQEQTPFVIQTDWDPTPGGIQNGERMRISSIGASDVPKPLNAVNDNITRVAVSHLGNQPITKPRSLLHLGYNTTGGTPISSEGWRNWMDVGTFYNRGSDNMYVGLKEEKGNDRFDAVVSWGDNQKDSDYLRFIFAASDNSASNVAQSYDGLEMMRMDPKLASTLADTNHGYGMVGIGDFSGASAPIDAKLDIDGDLRIREVTEDASLTRVLVIDPTDKNRVHWKTITVTGGSVGAHNGTSMSILDPSKVSFGNDVGATVGELLSDREVPMNNQDIYFTDNNATNSSKNRIGIGTIAPTARLHVKVNDQISENSPTGIDIDHAQVAANSIGIGLDVVTSGANNFNTGIKGFSLNGQTTSTAGWFRAGGTGTTYGVRAYAGGGTTNYGVYAQIATATPTSFAGYFNGNVNVNGTLYTPTGTVSISDKKFKKNVADLTNSMDLIQKLAPKTYDFKTKEYVGFNFEEEQQMGLIAQEVEKIIPAIVKEGVRPAQYNEEGELVAPEVAYKGVQYGELIPLLIGGIQEQQAEIQEKDALINDLNERLTRLENCLNGILPTLCQLSNSDIEKTSDEIKEVLINEINVELSDGENIILNQNVPNPFAESTVITYSIPTSVAKAQIHFYNGQGQLIKTVDVTERGLGKINVFGSDLSQGVYSYSLVADGKVVLTKRMIKQ